MTLPKAIPLVSPRRVATLGALVGSLGLTGLTGTVPALEAQEPVDARIRGQVLLADHPVDTATVILHRVSSEEAGQLDSVRVGADGRFELVLPALPDPAVGEVYFASTSRDGVLYFGMAVTAAVQLDSSYVIRTYPAEAAADRVLPVDMRTLFLEGEEGGWRVTDLFQIRNPGTTTLVPGEPDRVWSHPLPEGVTDFELGQGDVVPAGTAFEGGSLVVRAPLPPGERIIVVRYRVPGPPVSFPVADTTAAMELLIREPAPALEVSGMAGAPPVSFEGATYRHFVAGPVVGPAVELAPGREERSVPVRAIMVALALVLGVAGAWLVVRTASGRTGAGSLEVGEEERDRLILAVARLDEEFDATGGDGAARARYAEERQRLLRRLEALE